MKRSHLIHTTWAIVTIAAFVWGAHQSREARVGSPNPAISGPGSRSASAAKPVWPRGASTGLPGPGSSQTGRSGGDGDGSERRSAARNSADVPGNAARAPASGPLTEGEIDSLIQASIKSGSPMERRRAFDRLLEEMQSPTFSMEQAIAARVAMAKHGADGAQWRLFDYAWGANQPDAAIAHLAEIPERYHDAYLGNMIPGLASGSPQMAIDLFGSLEPKLQGRIRPRLLEGLVDNNVAGATDYIYASTDPENYNWRPMDELAREMVREQGLDSTLEWAAELPEGSLRGSAWSAAYAVWASNDPHSAVQAIIAMPEGTDRNLAINGFVSAHAHQDGERAATWAAQITEPGLRESAMIRVGRQYYEQNPEAAAEWFSSSGLPQGTWQRVTTSK